MKVTDIKKVREIAFPCVVRRNTTANIHVLLRSIESIKRAAQAELRRRKDV